MDILYLMIMCSVSLAVVFLVIFIVNAKKGQFEDDESPAVRILFDDRPIEENQDDVNKNEGEENKEQE